ncbi:MAG TPA: hypothetical protein VGP22_00655, partial [Albitalea sp.]|nr:hypothetical protein [Albitalea sp.]
MSPAHAAGVALTAAAIASAFAEEPVPAVQPAASQAAGATVPPQKNYALPALEILGFDLLLNRANNLFTDSPDYKVTLPSIRRNLRSGWVPDNDPFQINQFM